MPRPLSGLARRTRVLAGLAAVQLAASLTAAVVLQPPAEPVNGSAQTRARAALPDPREEAVRALLTARAAAMQRRDRAGWLAVVDPFATAFRRQQGEVFDALAQVPVEDWSYRLDPSQEQPAADAVDRRRGSGWWAPRVTLSYRLAPWDTQPTAEAQHLTFVPRNGRWFLAADDDFTDRTVRGLWDFGPVVAVASRSALVLGHPSSRSLLRTVANAVDDAVPRVTSVWGPGWAQRVVVLVPSSQQELEEIVDGAGDVSHIAAFAQATAPGVGERIVVNPVAFRRLSGIGRRVVLTHEATHVATRAATGSAMPPWLVEGFADYVGYVGVSLPYRVAAQELRDDVRRGRIPTSLPDANDFGGDNSGLASAYEQAWLAAVLLAEQHGPAGLIRLYRRVGSGATVDASLRALFGTDEAAFTRDWRRDLRTRLS